MLPRKSGRKSKNAKRGKIELQNQWLPSAQNANRPIVHSYILSQGKPPKMERLDTRHRWVDILTALGVPTKFLNRRHGPCPMCGGKDRFRFIDTDGKGTFFCNG